MSPRPRLSVKRNERTLTQRTAELSRAYMRLKELVAHGPVDTRVWLQAQAPSNGHHIAEDKDALPAAAV